MTKPDYLSATERAKQLAKQTGRQFSVCDYGWVVGVGATRPDGTRKAFLILCDAQNIDLTHMTAEEINAIVTEWENG